MSDPFEQKCKEEVEAKILFLKTRRMRAALSGLLSIFKIPSTLIEAHISPYLGAEDEKNISEVCKLTFQKANEELSSNPLLSRARITRP